MRPVNVTIGLSPADADGICASQTTAAAAELDLSGGALSAATGIARLATAAQIVITCAADETGNTFIVTGVNGSGLPVEERITGVSASAATSVQSYREVSRIYITGATSGNVSVGVSGSTQSISVNQTATAARALTITGIMSYEAKMTGYADNGAPLPVLIYSAGDDTGDTFTIYGQDGNGVDISEAVTGANADTATSTKTFRKVYAIYDSGASTGAVYAGWASDVDGIAKSQTMAGAGYLVMNGAKCTTQPRHVSIYSSADESAFTFTVVGTDRTGARLTEDITGPTAAATAKGNKNFATVQAVYINGNAAGNITVGSADECESKPIIVDYFTSGMSVAILHSTSDSQTHRFLVTLDNLLSGERNEDTARWLEETGTATANETFSSTSVVKAVRLEITGHVRGAVDMLMNFPGYND
ncbi:MAG: hypothetical protein C4542_08150 [Dehalococcoidia bacterium]|nr:MAG: hypothetical protein C4542_08150 [Dehalococcoidia bacterium]